MQDHNHRGTFVCPATGATHGFCPAIQGQDSRSVCPALNTMANHGYIRRDGQHITINQVVDGLVHCYCLSYPLAVFLAIGGYVLNILRPLLCGMPLHAFGVHGGVEHNASLVHLDAPPHQKYPPTSIQDNLVDALFPSSEKILTAEKVALQRIRRESELQQPLDPVHAEIARGEMAIMLGESYCVWCLPKSLTGDEEGAPLPYFRDFLQKECLPSGWVPDHVQGLFDVMRISKEIRSAMENIRRSRQEA
ncbi:Cloroperoxidase [Fistulina hepatica ATCC 64428]|uniref:Cloroperoxidase n=1 Tax=Fistulina hepatica ATCC 64428 TaxID=1128425 RepID=A0A0D7A593_9AGAR|nr:Cloroperoxidase [Fistulina hepatica ATCC 64428]